MGKKKGVTPASETCQYWAVIESQGDETIDRTIVMASLRAEQDRFKRMLVAQFPEVTVNSGAPAVGNLGTLAVFFTMPRPGAPAAKLARRIAIAAKRLIPPMQVEIAPWHGDLIKLRPLRE